MVKKTEIDFLIEQIEMDNLHSEGQMPKSCEYRVSILKVRGKSKVPVLAREITLKFRSEKTEDEVLKVAAKKIKEKYGLDVLEARVEDKTHSDVLNQAKVKKRDTMDKEQRKVDFQNHAAQHMRRIASHSASPMAMMIPFL